MADIKKYATDFIESRTEKANNLGRVDKVTDLLRPSTATTVYNALTEPVILSLADAWIGIGTVRPARTDKEDLLTTPANLNKQNLSQGQTIESPERVPERWDYTKIFHLELGEYLMPMSQTFSLRAKKRTNISSLVDGPDIIQQTRKESKTIDCTLRISTREGQENLKILKERGSSAYSAESTGTAIPAEVTTLASFLENFYDNDAILRVFNDEINNTFGVSYVFMTEYRYTPRVSMGTYTFEFTLMEVLYGENVITFNLREVDADAGTRRQITD